MMYSAMQTFAGKEWRRTSQGRREGRCLVRGRSYEGCGIGRRRSAGSGGRVDRKSSETFREVLWSNSQQAPHRMLEAAERLKVSCGKYARDTSQLNKQCMIKFLRSHSKCGFIKQIQLSTASVRIYCMKSNKARCYVINYYVSQ